MSAPHNLSENPIHLGLGAKATVQPTFTGEMEWYGDYAERNNSDGSEGRLVTMHSFDGAWGMWEMHPKGYEVVVCTAGELELLQEIDGEVLTTRLSVGQYAINAPGVWHTATDTGPCSALFITAGEGTEHRSD